MRAAVLRRFHDSQSLLHCGAKGCATRAEERRRVPRGWARIYWRAKANARRDAPTLDQQRKDMPQTTPVNTVYGSGYTTAIDNVNTSGWAAALLFLQKTAAAAVGLQEIRRTEGAQATEAEAAARTNKWSLTVGPAQRTQANGTSAGVGLAARTYYGLGSSKVNPIAPEIAARLRIAWFPGVVKGGVHILTMYLVSGQKLTSPANRKILEAATQLLDTIDGGDPTVMLMFLRLRQELVFLLQDFIKGESLDPHDEAHVNGAVGCALD